MKVITKKNNVDDANLPDKKLMFEFAKEVYFVEKFLGNKIYLKMKSFSKPLEAKTRFLSSNLNELRDRLKLLLQKKQVGKHSNLLNEKVIAIADQLLKYICRSTKKHSKIYKFLAN